jgi:hypothetical protein
MHKAELLGVAALALQLAWFAHEQLGDTRYFCWAPLHEHVWYRVDARVRGRRLDDGAVALRYGRRGATYYTGRGEFWELNAARHVIDSIALRERSLPLAERATVTLTFRTDDREARTWTYAP